MNEYIDNIVGQVFCVHKTPQNPKKTIERDVSIIKSKRNGKKSFANKKESCRKNKKRSSMKMSIVLSEKNKKENEKKKKTNAKTKSTNEKKSSTIKRKKHVARPNKNVEDDIMKDIMDETSAKRMEKVVGSKKLRKNIHVVPLDNMYFNF